MLALAVRRSPNLVQSDKEAPKLIRQFVRALVDTPASGPDYGLGMVVAGPRKHAEQTATLASCAAVQMDAGGFFNEVRTSGNFDAGVRRRLFHLEKLVGQALDDLDSAEAKEELAREHTWQLLSRLTVLMPRLESPDETDWSAVKNDLVPVARGTDLAGASRLRDRLLTLADDYAPKAARVDLRHLRRRVHSLVDSTVRRHKRGWQALDSLRRGAITSVRGEIATGGGPCLRLDRSGAVDELVRKLAEREAVLVSGESGVGKSALVVLGLAGQIEVDSLRCQAVCINLRLVPKLPVRFETVLGGPLSTLLSELSAPERVLIIDGCDAVAEGWGDAFHHLVEAAKEGGVKVVAVSGVDTRRVLLDTLNERFAGNVGGYEVSPLSDAELDEAVRAFPELGRLREDSRSREILRRLVVVDLLIRSRVQDVPLTDADAMNEVWSGLVRQRESSHRGYPDARESALLRLADLELSGGDRLKVVSEIDAAALDGLWRDGLLRRSHEEPFKVGPEFAHDEVRRYAVARLLLSGDTPASRLLQAGAPRWSLSAAQLACLAWLGRPRPGRAKAVDRLGELQASFDALDQAGCGVRWRDVPGEALLGLAAPAGALRDALPGLRMDSGEGLTRLARLVEQRLSDDNGLVNVAAADPVIALFVGDEVPWQSFDGASSLLRNWLRAHVVGCTAEGHRLRVLLRRRLVEGCTAGERRLAEDQAAAAKVRAARSPAEIKAARRFEEENPLLFTEIGYGGQSQRHRRRGPEVPRELRDKVILELLALLGPDLGEDGERILRRVAGDAPEWLAPAVEELLTGRALAAYGRGLLAHLTEAYYVDDEEHNLDIHDHGIRDHHGRSFGVTPLAAWYRGPFMPLLHSDFRSGVAVLNRLLNHAARVRARISASYDQEGEESLEADEIGRYRVELRITGSSRRYLGDANVWHWYRGNAVGPFPCASALQALERVCDQLIEHDVPVGRLVSTMLNGCENLAMVGLIVGVLVRHLERVGDGLDPYLAEPLVWRFEFNRVAQEMSGLAAGPEGIVKPDRRNWSIREAAMNLVVRATDERASELRAVGRALIANAQRQLEAARDHQSPAASDDVIQETLVMVRGWASALDRKAYSVHERPEGFLIQASPPDDVVQALQEGAEDRARFGEWTRLNVRYGIGKDRRKEPLGREELV